MKNKQKLTKEEYKQMLLSKKDKDFEIKKISLSKDDPILEIINRIKSKLS